MQSHTPLRRGPEPYAPTILIADDDPSIRRLFGRILEEVGYLVIEVNSGRDALVEIRSRTVDVMVIDLCMPEMDGLELIQAVRKELPEIKVLMISGFMGALLPVASQLGANATLAKPFRPEALLSAVCDLLRNK